MQESFQFAGDKVFSIMVFYATQVKKETYYGILCGMQYLIDIPLFKFMQSSCQLLAKVWVFGLPRVPFINCRQSMYLVISFWF